MEDTKGKVRVNMHNRTAFKEFREVNYASQQTKRSMVGTAWSANLGAQSKVQTSCTYQMGRARGKGMGGVVVGGKGGVYGFKMGGKRAYQRGRVVVGGKGGIVSARGEIGIKVRTKI